MSKIAIVTDSTAALPASAINGYSIFVIPLQLIWGDTIYRDGVDIKPEEFYEKLAHSEIVPTTSQPSPAAFHELYSRLLNEGHEILSIHISSKLSGTVDSALQAKDMLPGAPIEVVDSEATSMAMGFQVLHVARAIRNGASLKEAKEIAEKARQQAGVYFVVSTLEYLHRGGRIGGAAAFLGTVLNLKPVLALQNGRVEAVERVRTMSKAMNRMLDLVERDLAKANPFELCVVHCNAPDVASILRERVSDRFGISAAERILFTDVSPVIGTHAGPGTVGLSYFKGSV